MLYAHSFVVKGRGMAIVAAVGPYSQIAMAYTGEHSEAIHIKPDRMELEQILSSYFHYVRDYAHKFFFFFFMMVYFRKWLV